MRQRPCLKARLLMSLPVSRRWFYALIMPGFLFCIKHFARVLSAVVLKRFLLKKRIDSRYQICYHINVSKRDKLIKKILNGNSGISPDEAVKILEMLGFKTVPPGGSHLVYNFIWPLAKPYMQKPRIFTD